MIESEEPQLWSLQATHTHMYTHPHVYKPTLKEHMHTKNPFGSGDGAQWESHCLTYLSLWIQSPLQLQEGDLHSEKVAMSWTRVAMHM